jgi:II/X family phage/plasmid replication protein
MWDKLDLRIPFKAQFVREVTPRNGERAGCVDFRLYDFKAHCSVLFTDGKTIYENPQVQHWDSVPTSISDMAVGFFPEGQGFYPWPCISIKASPTKILQGHNVFGTENIRPGVEQMLGNLAQAFPKIYPHLDIQAAEVRYVDSTYSAFVPSEYQRSTLLRVFEKLCPNKDSISKYHGYLKLNKNSVSRSQKIYYKAQELAADYDDAVRAGQRVKAAILGDQRLHDFAFGRMRFEATTGHRAMNREGIPTKLSEFLKFHDWYQRAYGEPLCRWLWSKTFDSFFAQIEGHTMKNVDDNAIKLKIDAMFITIRDDGRICKRKANAIWKTYRQIKTEGYDALCRENNQTFFRNVKFMEEAGISRAFLKSLDPDKPNENVIPLMQIIRVDFSKQRPDWYVEPQSGYEDERRHLRLVS